MANDTREVGRPPVAEAETDSHARTTYRYLRVAMVVLLASIAVAVGYEVATDPADCWQRSISAYYYTPARAVFVSAVLALGVCLVTLQGNTTNEDSFLNLAGMFAPVVALVPTPNPGTCTSNELFGLPVPLLLLGQATPTAQQLALVKALQEDARDDAVANNMTALFVAGAICLMVALLMLLKSRAKTGHMPRWFSPKVAATAVILYAGALYAFVEHDDWFDREAHGLAAVLMFSCIVIVVGLNARGLGRKKRKDAYTRGAQISLVRAYGNLYAQIAVVMVVWAGGLFAFKLAGFRHAVFLIEAGLLVLFAIFWVRQSKELWNAPDGLREPIADERLTPPGTTAQASG